MEAALEGTLSPNRLPFTLHNAKSRSSRGMEKRAVIISFKAVGAWKYGQSQKRNEQEKTRILNVPGHLGHQTCLELGASQYYRPLLNERYLITLARGRSGPVRPSRVSRTRTAAGSKNKNPKRLPGVRAPGKAHPQAPHVARTGQDSQKKTETSERAVNATNRRANRLPPLRPLDDGFFSQPANLAIPPKPRYPYLPSTP